MKETEKICIIDDDEIYIFLIKKSLTAMGINNEVISFLNGSEALEEFVQFKNNNQELPGIILLDINMPIMDGWEFLTEFRKVNSTNPKKIPIYIVSSSIANEDFEKSKTYPEILDYLSKPLELETLETILNF